MTDARFSRPGGCEARAELAGVASGPSRWPGAAACPRPVPSLVPSSPRIRASPQGLGVTETASGRPLSRGGHAAGRALTYDSDMTQLAMHRRRARPLPGCDLRTTTSCRRVICTLGGASCLGRTSPEPGTRPGHVFAPDNGGEQPAWPSQPTRETTRVTGEARGMRPRAGRGGRPGRGPCPARRPPRSLLRLPRGNTDTATGTGWTHDTQQGHG